MKASFIITGLKLFRKLFKTINLLWQDAEPLEPWSETVPSGQASH